MKSNNVSPLGAFKGASQAACNTQLIFSSQSVGGYFTKHSQSEGVYVLEKQNLLTVKPAKLTATFFVNGLPLANHFFQQYQRVFQNSKQSLFDLIHAVIF
jgi:hypothetical protein